MGIAISRAEKKDALEFYNLEARCFEMNGDDPDTLYYWVPILAHMYCLKAVNDDRRIVGGIVTMPTYEKEWYINSLFVDPAYRRSGIGTMLMEKVLAEAWMSDMVLDVKTDRPYLLDFYNGFGFRMEGKSANHYCDDSDRFIMRRRSGERQRGSGTGA